MIAKFFLIAKFAYYIVKNTSILYKFRAKSYVFPKFFLQKDFKYSQYFSRIIVKATLIKKR